MEDLRLVDEPALVGVTEPSCPEDRLRDVILGPEDATRRGTKNEYNRSDGVTDGRHRELPQTKKKCRNVADMMEHYEESGG